ncbi:hypothetical protein L6R50_03095 [Myxococcota bacterium]|nr:hypothetical protein [Myxococcota bacterium]
MPGKTARTPFLTTIPMLLLAAACGGGEPPVLTRGPEAPPEPASPAETLAPALPAPAVVPPLPSGVGIYPKARTPREVAPGVTLSLPSRWQKSPIPGEKPKGTLHEQWGGPKPKEDGPGGMVVMTFESFEVPDPVDFITASAAAVPEGAPPYRARNPAGCRVFPDAATACFLSLVAPDGAAVERTMVFRGQQVVQIDLMSPPELGEPMWPELAAVARTVDVKPAPSAPGPPSAEPAGDPPASP